VWYLIIFHVSAGWWDCRGNASIGFGKPFTVHASRHLIHDPIFQGNLELQITLKPPETRDSGLLTLLAEVRVPV